MHWMVHLEGGPKRVNHAAVAVGKLIYSFGGCYLAEETESQQFIDVFVLSAETLRWKPVLYPKDAWESIPFQRYGHTVVAYNHKVFLFGGRNDNQSSNVLHAFDLRSYKWTLPNVTGPIPHATDGHTACIIGDYMYVYGGYEDETQMFKEGLHRINLLTYVWEEVKTVGLFPESRDFHTASVIGDKMYIFGGRNYDFGTDNFDGGTYSNAIVYLDTSSMMWVWPKAIGQPPCGRRSHSAFVYKNDLFVICGFNSITERHFNDMYKFNTERSLWSPVHYKGKGPSHRRRQCCCIVNDRIYLFGGTSPKPDLAPTLYRLCLSRILALGLDTICLPKCIKNEIYWMTTNNETHEFPYFTFPRIGEQFST